MSQLCQIQGGIQKQAKRRPVKNKYPFLRVANVYRNELRLDEIHEVELFQGELERLALEIGDILIVEGNGSKTEIGRCAIWNGEIQNAVHQNHLIRTRPIIAKSKFISTWLNSPFGMVIMSELAATTSGLYTLSVSKISRIPVPLPPLSEQAQIDGLVESGLEDILRQEQTTEVSLQQSEAQRKNILKDAFSGKLVPQNPDDEPASVLLDKIQAERAEKARQPKPKRQRKQKAKVITMDTLLEVLKTEAVWIDAQKAFELAGVKKNTETDRIEALYLELKQLITEGKVESQRIDNKDQLRLCKDNNNEA